jgi:hypothetical protein
MKTSPRRPSCRPRVEYLEQRLAPAAVHADFTNSLAIAGPTATFTATTVSMDRTVVVALSAAVSPQATRIVPFIPASSANVVAEARLLTTPTFTATLTVRSDLFGFAALPSVMDNEYVDVVPVIEHRAGTPRGDDPPPAAPIPHSLWSRLGTDTFDITETRASELLPAARWSDVQPVLAPAPAASPAMVAPQDATALPLLVGLLGVGALLALKPGCGRRTSDYVAKAKSVMALALGTRLRRLS